MKTDLQAVSTYAKQMVDEILNHLQDGYSEFSLKQVNQVNPVTGERQEGLLLDMVKGDETKTVVYHLDEKAQIIQPSEITKEGSKKTELKADANINT